MYKLDLPIDNIEAAAIARRRNREAQRQSRIFNAKTRLIGVSTDQTSSQQWMMNQWYYIDMRQITIQPVTNPVSGGTVHIWTNAITILLTVYDLSLYKFHLDLWTHLPIKKTPGVTKRW